MAEDIAGAGEDADVVEVLDTNFSDNANATEMLNKFQELVQNDDLLNNASEYLLDELISDAIFGVFLEVHHLRKTGNLVALDGHPENCDNFDHNASNANSNTSTTILPLNSSLHANTANTSDSCGSIAATTTTNNSTCQTVPTNLTAVTAAGATGAAAATTAVGSSSTASSSTSSLRIVDLPNYDIFGMSTAKKPIDCTCPNCDRLVSAARFAPHLEKCMGMGRLSSRIASRRLATKEVNASSSTLAGNSFNSTSTLTLAATYLQQTGGIPTDDEDDIEWSSSSFEKRRKKINQSTRNNGTKKNNGKTC